MDIALHFIKYPIQESGNGWVQMAESQKTDSQKDGSQKAKVTKIRKAKTELIKRQN